MKMINLTEAKDRFSEIVSIAQGEKILVLKHGKPAALVQGVKDYELGEIIMYADAEFWRWAARRQLEAAKPARLLDASEARQVLLGPDASEPRRRPPRPPTTGRPGRAARAKRRQGRRRGA
jgi:prevent-host-death family protein